MIKRHFKRTAFTNQSAVATALTLLAGFGAAPAAADPFPPVSLSIRETLDLWDNVAGGVHTGTVLLNKLQLSGSLHGDDIGLESVTAHVQVFRTDGGSLSSRVGDIQTVSNIEAVPTFRLFESWIEKKFGERAPRARDPRRTHRFERELRFHPGGELVHQLVAWNRSRPFPQRP